MKVIMEATERRLSYDYDNLGLGLYREIRHKKPRGAGGQSTDPTSQVRETNAAPSAQGDSQPNTAAELDGMQIDIKPDDGAIIGAQKVIFDATQQ